MKASFVCESKSRNLKKRENIDIKINPQDDAGADDLDPLGVREHQVEGQLVHARVIDGELVPLEE